MPYQFEFKNETPSPPIEPYLHQYGLACQQCVYINPNNHNHCKRKVCIGLDLCFQHLALVKHLKIKQSTIPDAGKGLFSFDRTKGPLDIVFKLGDVICEYDGEHIDFEEKQYRYNNKTAPYAIEYNNNEYIDDARERYVGSLINHKAMSHHLTNVRFLKSKTIGKIKIIATKNIINNRELFASYGSNYKLKDEGASYATKYVKKYHFTL